MSTQEIERDISREAEEYFEKQLERVNSWLSFAEAKNAGLIAVNIAFLAVIIELFKSAPYLFVAVGIVLLISCLACLISFIPQFSSKALKILNRKIPSYDPEKEYNLIFYKDIAEINDENIYIGKVKAKYFSEEISITNKSKDLAFEIMDNCKITMNKYMWFKIALFVDIVAIVLIAILFILA